MGATICRPYFWRYARGQTNTHTDTHVQTDRQTRTSQYSAPLWGTAKNYIKTDETIEVVVCCVDSGGLRLLRPRIRWGEHNPHENGHFQATRLCKPRLIGSRHTLHYSKEGSSDAASGYRRGVVVSGVLRMNEVNPRRARLAPARVTVLGRVYHLGM